METHRRSRSALAVPITLAAATVATYVIAAQPWSSSSPPLVDGFFLTLVSVTILPYLIVVCAMGFARDNPWVWWPAFLYGAITGLTILALDIAVLFDDSSTASLAFVWLPIHQLLGILPVAAGVILAKLVHDRRHGTTQRPGPAAG